MLATSMPSYLSQIISIISCEILSQKCAHANCLLADVIGDLLCIILRIDKL